MKFIFVIIFSLFTNNSHAQGFNIIRIENLNGVVQNDTLNFRRIGRYVGCVIQDQYETVRRLPIDTFPDNQARILSYEFSPPQYDSTVQTIEVHPAYSFYELNHRTKLPKGASLVPPTWEIRDSIRYVGSELGFKRIKEISSTIDDTECFSFSLTELSTSVWLYKRVLKTPAVLIRKMGDQILRDTLKPPSIYLEESIIPARNVQVTKYKAVSPARIQVKSSLPNAVYNLKRRRLVREGKFSDLREYISGCIRASDSTVAAIQKSLRAEGYRVKINDIVDKRTKKALIKYQLRHNLPVGNLNMETLKALDIDRFMKYTEKRRFNKEVECGMKNTTISDEGLIDDLIMLQALPDTEISKRCNCGLKTVKMRRKALKIREIKRQLIAFISDGK